MISLLIPANFRLLGVFAIALLGSLSAAAAESGFTNVFAGKTPDGWRFTGLSGRGLVFTNGTLVCQTNGTAALFSERDYENFILRFEFRLASNSSSGVAIRAPLYGDPAVMGLKVQIVDDMGTDGALLPTEQRNGAIFDLAGNRRPSLKRYGEWNSAEIRAEGRWIEVTINNLSAVALNVARLTDPDVLAKHPGALRPRGRIGFLGQGSEVAFRKVELRELPSSFHENKAPYPGFVALFDGKTLTGWKGLLAPPNDNPIHRGRLDPQQLKAAQELADRRMREHWQPLQGALEYDGQGDSLCSLDDYGDMELFVDWKITPHGDSGIYLRGSPQVQIWDPFTAPVQGGSEVGSGGLYNNERGPSKPTVVADRPIGEWNTFHILMLGERVTVFLNDELVTWNVPLENYWDRAQKIFPSGQIELQNHGNKLWFRNIYLRELIRP
jgi:hypothetical protein